MPNAYYGPHAYDIGRWLYLVRDAGYYENRKLCAVRIGFLRLRSKFAIVNQSINKLFVHGGDVLWL